MTSALISVVELVDLLRTDHPPVVVDAHVNLPSPRWDGDHRSWSGLEQWQAAHIPGSIHLDLLGELADEAAAVHFAPPKAAELARRLAARGIGKESFVVVYDHGDLLWAARLWRLLTWIGIEARVLDGGLPAWSASQSTSAEPSAGATPAEAWVPEVRHDVWASKDDVLAITAGATTGTVVCALAQGAFEGTAPTRYARRGHIPGSINIPARAHVSNEGTLQGREVLAEQWAEVQRPVVVYCGGGISASLSALALHEIGVSDVRIYDGSLEEWAADAALGLVTVAP